MTKAPERELHGNIADVLQQRSHVVGRSATA